MRSLRYPFAIVLGASFAACGTATPTQPHASAGGGASSSTEPAEPSCTLAVHAVLREAGATATVGQVQFRVDPPPPGESDATVQYRGVFGPTGGPTFEVLSVALLSRVPGQGPTWTDFDKSDPGTTSTSVIEFGRIAPMSRAMALALVDDPSSFKSVVNVVGATGGREAEGIVEPSTSVPESLRDRQRLCFEAD